MSRRQSPVAGSTSSIHSKSESKRRGIAPGDHERPKVAGTESAMAIENLHIAVRHVAEFPIPSEWRSIQLQAPIRQQALPKG